MQKTDKSLDDQRMQFFNRVQDAHVVIKPFTDLEDFEHGEGYDTDPHNGYGFVEFA